MIIVKGTQTKTSNDTPNQNPPNPEGLKTLWFLPGGGGNWVSYMTWCYYNNVHVPGKFWHFSPELVWEKAPGYNPRYWLQHHDNSWHGCDIVLGSNRSWVNYFLNNHIKNNPAAEINDTEIEQFDQPGLRIDYNLHWHDIVESPENFIQQLNNISGHSIQFNSIVEHCFVQYLDSSYPNEYRGNGYKTTLLINRIHRHIASKQARRDLNLKQRIEHAWEILDSQWIKYNPATWHG